MNKEEVILKLKSINLEGMDKLIEYMISNGFFESPASTRFHGSYDGGLLDHCVHLYKFYKHIIATFEKKNEKDFSDCPSDNDIFLCAILHDMCKVGAYVKLSDNNYSYKTNHPQGHAILSINIVKEFIKLTPLQESMIRYHMGYYSVHQLKQKNGGEYDIETLKLAQNNRYVKLFYFADDIVSQFWDK